MDKSQTQEKILNATLQLISEKGYLGATTREIAHKAGVTELTLFRHFGSKEKLFEEVLMRYSFLPMLDELRPELEKLSYDKALTLIGIRFLETLKKRKPLIIIMLSEINIYPDKIRAVYNSFIEELIQTLASYLDYLQKRALLRKFNHKTAARAFLGMIFSYFKAEEIIKKRNISRKEIEKTMEELVDIFVNGTLKINIRVKGED